MASNTAVNANSSTGGSSNAMKMASAPEKCPKVIHLKYADQEDPNLLLVVLEVEKTAPPIKTESTSVGLIFYFIIFLSGTKIFKCMFIVVIIYLQDSNEEFIASNTLYILQKYRLIEKNRAFQKIFSETQENAADSSTKVLVSNNIFHFLFLFITYKNRMDVAELLCLRSMCGVTRRDKVRNKEIRRCACGLQRSLSERGKAAVLRWFGHIEIMEGERLAGLPLL